MTLGHALLSLSCPELATSIGTPLTQTAKMLSLTNHVGDIFAAPDHTVLTHACNTQGKWGAGIAVAFKNAYPNAFETYRKHCLGPVQTGTCLLIEPCEAGTAPKHWVACLFTSAR
ncbi:hypothetical protein F4802DRAFT_545290 [Xylaria palmicola]|nr:hypothetical protein F4802DRAFT_545290 [Xylaria palmicola]